MGRYTVELTEEYDKHLAHWKKVGNKAIIKKIGDIMLELENHPTTGIGKPEILKGTLAGIWSRKLNKGHLYLFSLPSSIASITLGSEKYLSVSLIFLLVQFHKSLCCHTGQ